MFSRPIFEANQSLPQLPSGPEWQALLDKLGVQIDLCGPDDELTQLTRYAVGWVERIPKYTRPEHQLPLRESEFGVLFSQAGLVERINPRFLKYDYMLVDGGNAQRYQIRLDHVEQLRSEGYPLAPNLVVFGGQSLRPKNFRGGHDLTGIATGLLERVDNWGQNWLRSELAKSEHNSDPWQRPFATEREIGLLCLFKAYGKSLNHVAERHRENAVSLDASIPVPHIAADIFNLNDQRVTILNAPARVREHAGRKMPLSEARPTGRSCFYEWLLLDAPSEGSSVLFATHAPNIYRSWFDMVLRAAEAGRHDLNIEATGAALEKGATVGNVLEGLGNLIINVYNMTYEGGIDSPPSTPFRMDYV